MTREYTNLLLEAINYEYISAEEIVSMFTTYLSEDEIKEFCLKANDRELAWALARMKGGSDQSFDDTPELKSEWEYLQDSE